MWHNVCVCAAADKLCCEGCIGIENVCDNIFSRSNNQLYNCLTQFIKYLMNCLRFGHIYGFFRHPSSQCTTNDFNTHTNIHIEFYVSYSFNFSFILFTLVSILLLLLFALVVVIVDVWMKLAARFAKNSNCLFV